MTHVPVACSEGLAELGPDGDALRRQGLRELRAVEQGIGVAGPLQQALRGAC